jgi:hypothetical protein
MGVTGTEKSYNGTAEDLDGFTNCPEAWKTGKCTSGGAGQDPPAGQARTLWLLLRGGALTSRWQAEEMATSRAVSARNHRAEDSATKGKGRG